MLSIETIRLQNQQIEYPKFQNPVDVLSHLGAIQGQDYPGAKCSLGLRLPDCTDAQIEQAILDKQIVRTWLMRGTLFLTTAADVRWLVDLTGARVIKQFQSRYRQLELDEKTLSRSNDILVKALADGKQLRRRKLYAILEEQGISTKGQRGVYLVSHASLEGLIVQGSVSNNDPIFMRMDAVVADSKTFLRDEALAELARRYFTSRGLATVNDFAWWTGFTLADARAGLEAVKSELVEEKINGESYWMPANTRTLPSAESPVVYTPPGFDEYLLGYKIRDAVLEKEHSQKVCPGNNGVFFPTVVIDGQMCAIWKRVIKKKQILITVTPFTTFTVAEKAAFSAVIQRYGDYMEMPLEITFA